MERHAQRRAAGRGRVGVVSPILSNIYLDKLDRFVENVLIPEHTRGGRRASNPAYRVITDAIYRARKRGDRAANRMLHQQQRRLPSQDPQDPDYRRLRYVRYADDHLLGFVGPRSEAEQIKQRLATFLRDDLKLELSPEKTLITHGRTGAAKFLGYEITVQHADRKLTHGRRSINGTIGLRVPQSVIKLKTLAAKHRSSVTKMARKHRTTIASPDGPRRCYEVTQERPGRKPLVARHGGIPLKRQRRAVIDDREPTGTCHRRKELITRLLARRCELCEQTDTVQVHQVRKLADLTRVPGKPQPAWKEIMARKRRKTLIVCPSCHGLSHAPQPTAPTTEQSLESRMR